MAAAAARGETGNGYACDIGQRSLGVKEGGLAPSLWPSLRGWGRWKRRTEGRVSEGEKNNFSDDGVSSYYPPRPLISQLPPTSLSPRRGIPFKQWEKGKIIREKKEKKKKTPLS